MMKKEYLIVIFTLEIFKYYLLGNMIELYINHGKIPNEEEEFQIKNYKMNPC